MKTQIKKIGTSKGIILNKDFLKYKDLSEGDWVDTSQMHKVDKEENR